MLEEAFLRTERTFHSYRVRAAGGKHLFGRHSLEVGSGEAQAMAYPTAVDDAPRPCVRAPQQTGGSAYVAGLQGTADGRAADVLALQLARRHHVDANLAPYGDVVVERLALRTAEMVVVADDERRHAQPLAQHLLHELPGRERCHSAVERQDEDVIDPRGPEQPHLLLGRRQQQRLAARSKHRARMAVESDEKRTRTAPTSFVQHLPDKTFVAAVYAVEEADGTDNRPNGLSPRPPC